MIIDISPLIDSEFPVFPGDTGFHREVHLSFEQGHHLHLSSITSTLHIGAHADAPSHYSPEGQSIDRVSLNRYIGPCQVIEVHCQGGEIHLDQIERIEIKAQRILFKTNSFNPQKGWTSNFSFVAPEVVSYLAEKCVVLIGIDTPSMDGAQSKDLQAHQTFFRFNINILEGLILNDASPGLYTLIALPLKLKDAEASPVRAILMPLIMSKQLNEPLI